MNTRNTRELVPEPRPRKRTVRMRVFNFKPLSRPHDEEVATPERNASPARTSLSPQRT